MKKLISIISAVAMLGALVVAPTHAAVGESFTVQAEETSSYTLKGNSITGIPTQGACGGVGDFTKYYKAEEERPAFGETGDGIKVADWGTYVYALTLRPAGGGIDSLTYTVDAPCAGSYDMDIYAGNWDSVMLSVSVNGGDAVTSDLLTKNLSGYSLSTANKDNNFVKDGTISIDLKKGTNTIVVTANKSIYLDKYVFTCTEEKSGGSSDPVAPDKTVEILTEAEEATSFTVRGVSKDGIPDAVAVGSASDYPKYYANDKEQATCGESGNGIAINQYAKAYSITLRPAGGGVDSLTYTVNAPYAGTYALSMRVCTWNSLIIPSVKVNGADAVVEGIAQTAGSYSLTPGTDNFSNVNVGEVTLNKGANKITFATPKDFFFDAFTLKSLSLIIDGDTVEYIVNGVPSDKIASGNLQVKVNHGEYDDAEKLVGAIFDDGRFVSAAVATVSGTSTTVDFGAFASDSNELTFKYFVFSSLDNLTPAVKDAPAPTPTPTPVPVDPEPGDLGGIVVQAEETSSFTLRGVEVDGAPTQESAGGAGDFAKIYNATDVQPTVGETGDGIKVASWGSKVYAMTLRPAKGGVDSLTYKVNATEAGRYAIYFNVASWYTSITPSITVNGLSASSLPFVNNMNGYSLAVGSDNFKMVKAGIVTLVEGENTITIATEAGRPFYFDAFELVKTDDTEPIKVEAEEFDYYVINDVYESAEALFAANPGLGTYNAGGTGNGVVGNAYNKVYSMTFHKSGPTSGIAYYTVSIPKSGKYKVNVSASCGSVENALIIESGPVFATVSLANTGSWGGNYAIGTGDQLLDLEAGEFEFTVYGGDCYADYITFTLQK